jgi:glycosyltransferase involved in cell wall biosynthesis
MTKKKILVLSDHPLSPSGVGTQTKYMIEALLKTGRYQFICLGGAMKHADYTPITVDPYGKDFLIIPVDGYGNEETVRSALRKEKPDALWFMTDPRFYEWLWQIEDEVRSLVPMIYYHVWDNFPVPLYNKAYYDSTDYVVSISRVTEEIVRTCSPDSFGAHISHAVNSVFYRPLTDGQEADLVKQARDKIFSSSSEKLKNPKKKIFFWNNRNARRKQSGTLIWWFKEWLDKVGHDKATLVMHTDARDQHGQDLPHIIEHLGLNEGQVLLSTNKVPPEQLSIMYNASDYTINISDAEGFGLATLESLSCGTPIIVNMTGGLQEQVTNGTEWFGWGIQPSSKSIIGSLQVPYIYEDRISQSDFEKTMTKALKQPKTKYKKMSEAGIKHVKENFSFENYEKQWVEFMDRVVAESGSWETRKNYKRWHLMEVA